MEKAMPAGRQGFTLVEIVVVLGIFGVLMIVATDFFISVIQNSTRTTLQAEARQNAQKIMQDITVAVQGADSYAIMPNGDLITSSASGRITYHLDQTGADPGPAGNIWSLYKNGAQINSNGVAVLVCGAGGCGITCPGPTKGLTFSQNSNGTLTTTLVIQQRSGSGSSAYCAITTLTNSAQPRVY